MMTVQAVSRLTGVSIRTLHYYDQIGLLPATAVTEVGYRLYDEKALQRLQQILLFREIEFPLKEIRKILDSPAFDSRKALEQQIRLLELRREHINGLIDLARGMIGNGEKKMSFEAFDKKKIEMYQEQAKAQWGTTEEYKEFEQKEAGRSSEEKKQTADDMMKLFEGFGRMKEKVPDSAEAMAQAGKLQEFITANYYHCSDEILLSLADMYAAGGEFTQNIDRAGGEGTAEFAVKAIRAMIAAKEK